MDSSSLDGLSIQFSDDSLIILNICLGLIMFGVALGLETRQFRQIFITPRAVLAGVIAQFLLLPFLTFVLVWILRPHPAIALGMILVAACPGGNISNFISSICNANVALSITLTAVATFLSPIFTPGNFELWSGALDYTGEYLQSFSLSFLDMLSTVLLLLVLPLILGLIFQKKLPKITNVIEKPIRIISFLILMGFILIALFKNLEAFKNYLYIVFFTVLLHNLLALTTGYLTGLSFRLSGDIQRTLSIETGIQNSGLGLIIIFNFFGGNAGMALVAAWWGIWHIISGLLLAYILKMKDRKFQRT